MKIVITLDEKNFGGRHYHAAHIEQIDDNNVHSSKYISIQNLISALSHSVVSEDRFYRLGKMPHNYYDGLILRNENEQISGEIALSVPMHRTTIHFEDTDYQICFPALFFYFSIKDSRIGSTYVFALKGNQWNEDDVLYNYPFGNVSTDYHNVCWGSNQLPAIETLQTLDVVVSLFYDSPTNNDYYSAGESTRWKEDNLRAILKRLDGLEKFPEKILMPSNCGTIGDFLNRAFEGNK